MTEAQGRVLAALRGIDGRWPVTTRQVARAVGLKSSASAHRHLVALEAAGLVESNPVFRGGWKVAA